MITQYNASNVKLFKPEFMFWDTFEKRLYKASGWLFVYSSPQGYNYANDNLKEPLRFVLRSSLMSVIRDSL